MISGLILGIAATGCSDHEYLVTKSDVLAPIKRPFRPETWVGPTPSQRSLKTLQRFNLVVYDKSSWIRNYSISETLKRLQKSVQDDATPEKLYALTELAFLDAQTLLSNNKNHAALERFTLALVNAYGYLFTPQFEHLRNPYDPQFQEICRMYNQSLEQAMRVIASDGQLKPGVTYGLHLGAQQVNVEIRFPHQGQEANISELRFVSDFRIQKLLRHHRTFGLGVPMIGVFNGSKTTPAVEQYYPPGMCLPMSAFIKVIDKKVPGTTMPIKHCILEFHNTVDTSELIINRMPVPLQTDTSIPLAFLLDQPSLSRPRGAATTSLLNPTEAGTGLFMIEPYDPNKTPVIMIHGFWSSPMIWMNMVNDLRSVPNIRQNYQFWFYQYPTSQPFWISATKFRKTLDNLYQNLDPKQRHEKLHQTVLIGHSMGGLIS
ncbi:MAG: alpha/beta hydrolase, partial [Planctomycetota bacterium]|nr:alpha/beta hydrolase [Planctomycetota bacterium]